MALSDYQSLPLYEQGEQLIGDDFIEGRRLKMWLAPLGYKEITPTQIAVTNDTSPIAVDATTCTLSMDTAVTIYRGDVIFFSAAPGFIVCDEDTVFPATTPTAMKILPNLVEIAADDATGLTYGLAPLLSLQDGGSFETSGVAAIARTKAMGLEPARKMIERDGIINIAGQLYVDDPAASILDTLQRGARNVYVELRYDPYIAFTDEDGNTVTEGRGIGAISGSFTVNYFNVTANRADLINVNGNLEQAGPVVPYNLLGAP